MRRGGESGRKIKKKEGRKRGVCVPYSLNVFCKGFDDTDKGPVEEGTSEIGNPVEKDLSVYLMDQGSLNGRGKERWGNSKKNPRLRRPFWY